MTVFLRQIGFTENFDVVNLSVHRNVSLDSYFFTCIIFIVCDYINKQNWHARLGDPACTIAGGAGARRPSGERGISS